MISILRSNRGVTSKGKNVFVESRPTLSAGILFTYYLWDVYPLRGETSLLERYYQQTDGERSYWANLFDYVGRSLRNSGKHLDDALKDRIIQFFDWRLDVGEATELERFTFWMEAECLEPEWRLDAYSRILDIVASKDMKIFGALKTLEAMLPDHTAKVGECFAKITDHALKHGTYIPWTDQAKTMRAGLESDESVPPNAPAKTCSAEADSIFWIQRLDGDRQFHDAPLRALCRSARRRPHTVSEHIRFDPHES